MSAPALESLVRTLASELPAATREAVERAVPDLVAFLAAVIATNAEMNLVSSRSGEPETLVRRHLSDSLFGLSFLPSAPGAGQAPPAHGLRLLDIGSGGGFPALPLLLVRRDIEGLLMDSVSKKVRFLNRVIESLGLTAQAVNARFPDSLSMKNDRFDILTTRAVAHGGRLVRDARKFLRQGGRALVWSTEPLLAEARRESGMHRVEFHREPGAETRGIAVFECFT